MYLVLTWVSKSHKLVRYFKYMLFILKQPINFHRKSAKITGMFSFKQGKINSNENFPFGPMA